MQYAIKTRDYINDYVWSWENDDPSSPLAEVSLELQKQIEGGQKGIAVIFRSGSFHVIITGIYKLGDKPIGLDFSKTKIRLSLVFSGLSQPEVKGVIQYFFANQDNLGIGFEDIVSWTKDSWTINDEQLNLAFKLIPTCTKPGKSVFCDTGGLVNLSDFNFSEQTEGVKYVFQSNAAEYLKIDLEPVPQKEVPALTPPKETKPKSSGKVFSILSILCLLCAVGFLGWKYIQLNEELNTNNRDKIELNNRIETLEGEKSKLKSENASLKKELGRFESEKTDIDQLVREKNKALGDKEQQITYLQGQVEELEESRKDYEQKNQDLNKVNNELSSKLNSNLTQLKKLLETYHLETNEDFVTNLSRLKGLIQQQVSDINDLNNKINDLQNSAKQNNTGSSIAPEPTPADDVEQLNVNR